MKTLILAAIRCFLMFTAAAAFCVAYPAKANLITFDDLPGGLSVIPNGYNGLDWANFAALDATTQPYPNTGYFPAIVSPNNVAFNGSGDPALISDGAFDLNSGYFTAAWNDDLQLQVIGSLMGNPLYDMTFTLSATAPTLINLNYLGIDSVQFISFGGTPHPEYIEFGGGTQFALDNLVINQTGIVPDAGSTVMLLGIALGGIGYLRRRLG
jgi:hypothetical protein